jgi:hypothetical protein
MSQQKDRTEAAVQIYTRLRESDNILCTKNEFWGKHAEFEHGTEAHRTYFIFTRHLSNRFADQNNVTRRQNGLDTWREVANIGGVCVCVCVCVNCTDSLETISYFEVRNYF